MPHLLVMQPPIEWNQSVTTVCWPNHHWKSLEARGQPSWPYHDSEPQTANSCSKRKIIHACLLPNARIDPCGKCQAGFPALHFFFRYDCQHMVETMLLCTSCVVLAFMLYIVWKNTQRTRCRVIIISSIPWQSSFGHLHSGKARSKTCKGSNVTFKS